MFILVLKIVIRLKYYILYNYYLLQGLLLATVFCFLNEEVLHLLCCRKGKYIVNIMLWKISFFFVHCPKYYENGSVQMNLHVRNARVVSKYLVYSVRVKMSNISLSARPELA